MTAESKKTLPVKKGAENGESERLALLAGLVDEVVKQEKFVSEILPPQFNKYYKNLESAKGDRCVDGRPVVEMVDGQETGYKGENYTGAQMAGGTLGELDVLKKLTGLDETKARQIVKKTYDANGLVIAAHTDDEHGHINSLEELVSRKKGCGDQGAKTDGLLPMYSGQDFGSDLFADRLNWVQESSGNIFPLAGSHEEKLAALNLVDATTFDTTQAAANNESVFNCDVSEIYKRAGLFFDEMSASGSLPEQYEKREDFQSSFTQESVRNYFQTLVALHQPAKIFIRS